MKREDTLRTGDLALMLLIFVAAWLLIFRSGLF
jgi:hypothetical protein